MMRRASSVVFPVMLLACALLGGVRSDAQAAAARITSAVDETKLVMLNGNTHPAVLSQRSTEVAPDDMRLERMLLQLKRSDAQEAALRQLLDDQQNPHSARFHHWLTPDDFGTQFGAPAADIATITSWLQSQGFTIDHVETSRSVIQFSGTQAQLRRAFHTEIRGYTIHGEHHWANTSDPRIPAALATVVGGIVSLHDVRLPGNHTPPVMVSRDSSTGKVIKVGEWTTPATSGAGGSQARPQFTFTNENGEYHLMGPHDFATIYNLGPLWNAGLDGTGQTIAITARSNVDPADIDSFRKEFGLPEKKLNVILPTGVDPGTGAEGGSYNDEGETDLDVEWSGAVAKGATIDLVATPSTATTDGTDISDLYIIDTNLAPVMSVSYGTCEFDLQASGNQFFHDLWEQAAAQGITVIVSSGDYAAATCDEDFAGNDTVAIAGPSVNGLASTPYNVAVGGTDFKTFNTAPDEFWNATNDPSTLNSAQSYMPESPWNDSCANPEIVAWLNANGASFASTAALCQDVSQSAYQNFVGGGGGQSNCIASTDPNTNATCKGGYAKPSWQSILTGIPADNVRDVPDVSLFAANGAFHSLIPYCQSDELATGYTCATGVEAAGGTSFAAPSFAGVMAIVNQKMQTPQGVANYLLYKIAAQEFGDSNQLAACNASTVAAGNNCAFYDLTEGGIRVPCETGSTGCSLKGAGNFGWDAVAGYDLASGIGSLNAANLVSAWSNASANMLPSQTSLTAPETAAYGAPLTVNIKVGAVAPASGTPTGPVLVQLDGQAFSQAVTLNAGSASISLSAIPVGTYQMTASYGGDANFDESGSIASTFVVAKAPTTLVLSQTRVSAVQGQSVTFGATMQLATDGAEPTGLVTFTDSTTNVILGSAKVNSATDPNSGARIASATLTVPATLLGNGANTIVAAYSGDGNYKLSASNSVSVSFSVPFAVAIAPASLQIGAKANASGSVAVSLTPAVGVTLQASNLTFACSGTIAPGVSCAFTPVSVSSSSGSASSMLTVNVNTSQITPAAAPVDWRNGRLQTIAASGLVGFIALLLRKQGKGRFKWPVLMAGIVAALSLYGCGSSKHRVSTPIQSGPGASTTTLTVSSPTPAIGSMVTLTAAVSPAAGGSTPTGTVTFLDGGNALGTVTLSGGSASFSSNTLALGGHSMTAKYSGDTGDSASVSAAASVDVTYSTNLTVSVHDSSGAVASTTLPITVQ